MSNSCGTARTAVVMCAFLMAGVAGCERGTPDTSDSATRTGIETGGAALPPPPAPASAASAMTDTVPLASLVMWDAAGAQAALMSSGMRPRVIRSALAPAGLPGGAVSTFIEA